MFKNCLKGASRNIKRHKSHFFINVMGLDVDMAGFILITLSGERTLF